MAYVPLLNLGPCVLLALDRGNVNDITSSSQYGTAELLPDGTLACEMDWGYSRGIVVFPQGNVTGKRARLTQSGLHLPLGGGTSSVKWMTVGFCWITQDGAGYYNFALGSAATDFPELTAVELPEGGAEINGAEPATLAPMREEGVEGTFGVDGNAVYFLYEESLA